MESSGTDRTTDFRDVVREAESFAAIEGALRGVRGRVLTSRETDLVARALSRHPDRSPVRIAYLGNHTVEPLPRYVAVAAAAEGFGTIAGVGNYNQYMQEVLDPRSEIVQFDPQLIFLSVNVRGLAPRVFFEFLSLNREERLAERQRIVALFRDWIAAAQQTTSATLLIANPVRPVHLQAGLADDDLEISEDEFYRDLNADLHQLARGDARVYRFDLDRILSNSGKVGGRDAKLFYLAKMEWSEAVLPAIALEVSRYLGALTRPARKCLVLDLDDTLWGGIVGEDGVDGLRIGPGDPLGEAYFEIQQVISSYRQRGVLLALCSKNNEADVLEAFRRRPEMPLRWEDFAAVQVNWSPKHENLQRIAQTLGIGIDSLVFVDDNPVECALVRSLLPQVRTIEMSGDPCLRPDRLRSLREFDQLQLTAEDLRKTEQYQENTERDSDLASSPDLQSFLEGLQTTVTFGKADSSHLDRVHQLFGKTNQFNLTTRRYDRAEVETFWKHEDWDLFVGQVRDRFGDLGLVVVCLVERRGAEARLDSFVLSCRAMGRGVETAVMNALRSCYLVEGDMEQISACYAPTAKNKPAEMFYETEGFEKVLDSDEGGGRKEYQLLRKQVQMRSCPGITVEPIEEN